MPSVNQIIRDELLAHAIGLDQYGSGLAHRMILLLNRADTELLAAVAQALASIDLPGGRIDGLEELLAPVQRINTAAYRKVLDTLMAEMRHLLAYEVEFQSTLFGRAIPGEVLARVPLTTIDAEQVYANAVNEAFQGANLQRWMAGAERNRLKAIKSAISTGRVHGEAIHNIISEIRGATPNQTDGKLEGSRRGLASIVRTASAHAGAEVRAAFYQANVRLIVAEQWVAVLDNRTSSMCRLRDGKRYTPGDHQPIGHNVPWLRGPGKLHCYCRPHSEPILKSFSMLGLSLGEIGPRVRESMDGDVPANITYLAWLADQSAARQDEILGPTRGRLYREGRMPLEEMYSSRGDYLTLDQLRARDAAAFRRAGL